MPANTPVPLHWINESTLLYKQYCGLVVLVCPVMVAVKVLHAWLLTDTVEPTDTVGATLLKQMELVVSPQEVTAFIQ